MSGFYLITRGITKHHIFRGKPERLAVWLWLLDNAAWRDVEHDIKGQSVVIKRGSVCASIRAIASECGVGVQVVRTALKRFQSDNMIETNLTHGKTVISLCNYDKHQVREKPDNTRLTQDQHKTNTQNKEGNNKTNNNTSSNDDDFEAFWKLTPRKVGKGQARKAYRSALKKTDREIINRGMVKYAESVSGKDPAYIAHPATWLNGERWADETPSDTRTFRDKPQSEWTAKDREQAAMQWL